MVLGDIDLLFRVNRFINALDILSEFDLKATSATNTIAKTDRLSILVTGGGITLKDLFMAKSLMDNIGEQGTLGVLQTMSPSNDYNETTMYIEFKADKFSQSPRPSPFSLKKALIDGTIGPHTERTEGPLINRRGGIAKDNNTTGEVHLDHRIPTTLVRGATARTSKGIQVMKSLKEK